MCGETFTPKHGNSRLCSPSCVDAKRTKREREYTKSGYRRRKRREYLKAKPSKYQTMHYKSRYGVSVDTVILIWEAQAKCCAICGREIEFSSKDPERRLHVDHCHNTGRVRGALCRNCNTMLGQVSDNPDTLRRAIRYLRK